MKPNVYIARTPTFPGHFGWGDDIETAVKVCRGQDSQWARRYGIVVHEVDHRTVVNHDGSISWPTEGFQPKLVKTIKGREPKR